MSKVRMSGRTKRILYYVLTAVFLLGAVAGDALILLYGGYLSGTQSRVPHIIALALFLVTLLLFPLHTILHETGHALAGALCGMRVVALSVGSICLDRRAEFSVRFRFVADASGFTVVLPQREEGARGKYLFTLFSGSALELLYGAVFLALNFVLPPHPVLLYFVLFAPFAIFEGLISLVPVDLSGRTDGEFILKLMKREESAMFALRVMTAQGMLYRMTYADLPVSLLETPVIREDDLSLLAALQLNLRRELYCGGDATPYAERLSRSFDEIGEGRADVAADLVYFYAVSGNPARAEEYRSALEGNTAAALRAVAALERSEENISRAARAAEKLCAVGERESERAMLARLRQ